VQQCGQRIFDLMLKTASGQPSKSESFRWRRIRALGAWRDDVSCRSCESKGPITTGRGFEHVVSHRALSINHAVWVPWVREDDPLGPQGGLEATCPP